MYTTSPPNAPARLLGDMSPDEFLANYWQKKPLLVRQAVPGFDGFSDLAQLQKLAARDDVLSRRVLNTSQDEWHLEQGPFPKRTWKTMPAAWALLVQNLNHLLPAADALLHQFNFIPYARLDDLMVSYAPAGGGVGPHFDSYDVFLLQGLGRKRWQIAKNGNAALIPDLPLRILANFAPEIEWILEPGDMLYLPPKYAHYGVQLEPGTTYSIGFRAPSHAELAREFLLYLADHLHIEGQDVDGPMHPASHPAELPTDLLSRWGKVLKQVRWDESVLADFAGRYLSEPKPHVWFETPHPCWRLARFSRHVGEQGVALDPKAQCLYTTGMIYLNGEPWVGDKAYTPFWQHLADLRRVPPGDYPQPWVNELFEAYCNGYIKV